MESRCGNLVGPSGSLELFSDFLDFFFCSVLRSSSQTSLGLLALMLPRLAKLVAAFGDGERRMPQATGKSRAEWERVTGRVHRGGKREEDGDICRKMLEGTLNFEGLMGTTGQEAWLYCERTRRRGSVDLRAGCGVIREADGFVCWKVSGGKTCVEGFSMLTFFFFFFFRAVRKCEVLFTQ